MFDVIEWGHDGKLREVHAKGVSLGRARLTASTMSFLIGFAFSVEDHRNDDNYPNVTIEGWIAGKMAFSDRKYFAGLN